jgi:hypothetical protein
MLADLDVPLHQRDGTQRDSQGIIHPLDRDTFLFIYSYHVIIYYLPLKYCYSVIHLFVVIMLLSSVVARLIRFLVVEHMLP